MNANVARALMLDALYQVFDNKVFRILAGIVALMVLATFAIGAREEAVVILWGWKEYRYEAVFELFGLPAPNTGTAQIRLVEVFQESLVDNLAGTLGIALAVAATAFFLPRMLEKGAADVVFSKPVSRLALLVSRYVAGLVFVALLAVLLVGGIHVGLLANSGYSDPGFLWTIFTLVYLFAILHGVSILIGVLTGSTVAAILASLLLFAFSGCVHMAWKGKELFLEQNQAGLLALREDPESVDEDDVEEIDRLERALFATLDVCHYALPKTSDADLIAQKLRKGIENRFKEVWDEASGLSIADRPGGFERRGGELGGEGLLWVREHEGGGDDWIRLSRRPGKGLKLSAEAKALKAETESRPGALDVKTERQSYGSLRASIVQWRTEADGRDRTHRVAQFLAGGHLFKVEIEEDTARMEDWKLREPVWRFLHSFSFDDGVEADNPFELYEKRFGWNAELKYNMLFSIGSSLAFLIVALGLAAWKLARIDF